MRKFKFIAGEKFRYASKDYIVMMKELLADGKITQKQYDNDIKANCLRWKENLRQGYHPRTACTELRYSIEEAGIIHPEILERIGKSRNLSTETTIF